MSNIAILELHPVGSELFLDYESFLNDLTNERLERLAGGQIISQVSATAAYRVVPNQGAMANQAGMFKSFDAAPNYTVSVQNILADWIVEDTAAFNYWEWFS
ncbi:MAG: hypothetical protein WBF90_17115 [Rivularia sp. (in: cyanobacteria)]